MKNAVEIISASDFPQWMVDQTPVFDELVMQSIRPADSWLLEPLPTWFMIREQCRKIVEGIAFRESEPESFQGEPHRLTGDYFQMKKKKKKGY